MKFTHLVEINDPLNPLIDFLTREQLWRGLTLRAETPQLFVPWLDRCELLERTEFSLSRALHYGQLIVRDRVTFDPQHRIHYDVPAQKEFPASSLTVSIEEPRPEIFFVRFEYDNGVDDSDEEFYDEFRRAAYTEADIDTIRIIRQLAAEGRFESLLN